MLTRRFIGLTKRNFRLFLQALFKHRVVIAFRASLCYTMTNSRPSSTMTRKSNTVRLPSVTTFLTMIVFGADPLRGTSGPMARHVYVWINVPELYNCTNTHTHTHTARLSKTKSRERGIGRVSSGTGTREWKMNGIEEMRCGHDAPSMVSNTSRCWGSGNTNDFLAICNKATLLLVLYLYTHTHTSALLQSR